MNTAYDIAIIGGGSAGLMAARFAAQLGARAALVEKYRLGGECTWTGCVPSKTLVKAARVAHLMRTADRYGLTPVKTKVDLKAAMSHVRSVVQEVYSDESPAQLRAGGVAVYIGAARFLDSHTLMAGETRLSARYVLIATGAHPFIPAIDGIHGVDYLTYESIWDLDVLPHHLLVVGAGPIGCEMAQAFRRFGSRVTLVASRERVLPRDDTAASRVISEVIEREGVEVLYNAQATRVQRDAGGVCLIAGGERLVGDALLIVTGRRPNVDDLGLESAHVAYSSRGIQVDEHLRTNQRHIYAAGDCIGGHQFTHYAGWQSVMAVRNALLPSSSKGTADLVPWTTFTDPEVAHAGLTERQARDKLGNQVQTSQLPMTQVDRARAERDTEGFVKLVHKRNGKLLGATIVAQQAGEMIHEWIIALDRGMKISDLAGSIHVYPTYSTANWQIAASFSMERLLSGASGRVVRGLARLKR